MLIWSVFRPRAGAGRSQRHNPLFAPYNTEKDTGKPRGVQCELPVSFSVFGSETFASSPSPSVEGAGTIMRFFVVKIFVFLCCERFSNLYCLVCFLKMLPFGKQKAPAFSHENRCVERCSALGVGRYHFPFLILPTIRITENTATAITAEIHMGESTHIQLHWITPNSFSTIKIIVRTDTMPSPPCFVLLFILFL